MSNERNIPKDQRGYCQFKRHGMYVPNSTCGDVATATADGLPVCEVHERWASRAGFKIVPVTALQVQHVK